MSTPPYTVLLEVAGTAYNALRLGVSEAPADVATISFDLLTADAGPIDQDDQVKVTVTDNYDNENISRTWVAYVQEKRTINNVTSITAHGSEFWLGRRALTSAEGPDDIGVIVKAYVDDNGAPITSGGIDTSTGTNFTQDANYTTLLQLLEEARQMGFRSFVRYVDGGTPEQLEFFKESSDFKAATREIRYGEL